MKHKIVLVVAASLFALSFTACDKDEQKVFNANFYNAKSTGKMVLYLDQVAEGELSYMAQVPVCGQFYSDGAKPIQMTLNSGTYQIMGKNEQGQIVSSGVMKISANKMSVSGNIGGLSLTNNGDCLAVGLYEY